MSFADDVYLIAEELRAIANMGLRYAETTYDKDRYGRVLSASARLLAGLDGSPLDEVLALYEDHMNHVSPISGCEAAVFRDGNILLIKRGDNGLWAMPGGLSEVGETMAETAQRELWEEAHVRGRVTRLLGLFDSRLWGSRSKSHLFFITFQVEAQDGLPSGMPPETLDAGFFPEDGLPPLSPGHETRVPLVFRMARGELAVPYIDMVGGEAAQP